MQGTQKHKGGRPPSSDPKCKHLYLKIGKIDRSWLDKQDNVSEYIRTLIAKDRAEKLGNLKN
jgi:hypothetical protein